MELLYENKKIVISYFNQSLVENPNEIIIYLYIRIQFKETQHCYRTRATLFYYKSSHIIFTKHEHINCLKESYKDIVVNAISNSRYIYNLYSYLFKDIRKLNNE